MYVLGITLSWQRTKSLSVELIACGDHLELEFLGYS